MTEAELTEHLMAWFAQISGDADRYFTLVSAYLIVAYLVGRKLSLLQLAIINTLFLLWIGGIIAGSFSALEALGVIEYKLAALESDFDGARGVTGVYNVIAVYVGGVVASLIFMWSVRHSKTHPPL